MDSSDGIKYSICVEVENFKSYLHFGIYNYGKMSDGTFLSSRNTSLKIGSDSDIARGRLLNYYPEKLQPFIMEIGGYHNGLTLKLNLWYKNGNLWATPIVFPYNQSNHPPILILTNLKRRALIKLAKIKQKEINKYG